MADGGTQMVAFLGIPADPCLLGDERDNLPAAERFHEPAVSTHRHDRLVAAGSVMTGTTLVGGTVLALYAGTRLLFASGGTLDAILLTVGVLLVATHWGWVHVAEYLGLTIDDRQERAIDLHRRDWLAALQPYPRFTITTGVLADASTRVERVLHEPVLTPRGTFTFARLRDGEQTYGPDTSTEVIAATVETMRRAAALDTKRVRGRWEAASQAYDAALYSADDDEQRLAAQRAAATALSDHINASLLEPPLVE